MRANAGEARLQGLLAHFHALDTCGETSETGCETLLTFFEALDTRFEASETGYEVLLAHYQALLAFFEALDTRFEAAHPTVELIEFLVVSVESSVDAVEALLRPLAERIGRFAQRKYRGEDVVVGHGHTIATFRRFDKASRGPMRLPAPNG